MNSETESEGYLKDQPWSHGYHHKLSPHYIRFTHGMAGLELFPVRSVCELAYGHGVSLVINAAANPGIAWSGTDFNRSHADFARSLAGDALPNLKLSHATFADYLAGDEVGLADIVEMTGTWSWIPDTEQQRIAKYLSGNLRPGGAFCHDNMVLPGQSSNTALRQLLLALATSDPPARPADPERTIPTVRRAIDLMDTNPGFLHLFPDVRPALEGMTKTAPNHLAHEYFNYNWSPRYFLETAALMNGAGLDWCSPWSLSQQCDGLHFSSRQRAFLADISDINLREQVKDYIQCQSMRHDIWSKGKKPADPAIRARMLATSNFILVKPVHKFDWITWGSLGQFDLSKSLYKPVIDLIAERQAVTFSEISKVVGGATTEADTITFLSALIDGGWLQVGRTEPASVEAAKLKCDGVNRRILALANGGPVIQALASPMTGAGVKVPALHLIFLRARREGATHAEAYADHAAAQGTGSTKNDCGKSKSEEEVARTPEAFLASAKEFADAYLPIYQSLMIAD